MRQLERDIVWMRDTGIINKVSSYDGLMGFDLMDQGHLVKGEDTEAFSSPLWS
jgi:hypothetical protein